MHMAMQRHAPDCPPNPSGAASSDRAHFPQGDLSPARTAGLHGRLLVRAAVDLSYDGLHLRINSNQNNHRGSRCEPSKYRHGMAQASRACTSTPSTLSPATFWRSSAESFPSPQPISRSRVPGASIAPSSSASTAILRWNTTFSWMLPSIRMPALALMSMLVITNESPAAD